ncbi:MAG: hypothetical protein LBI67_00695 [Treponema sp.]|nr:hypothetical protein [Treponema sp.]
MTRPLFRPLQFWQSALMTLPDTAFFELMRSVLGNIKTPFNKQRLLGDLSAFLARPGIQETITAFLDDGDRRIIAAIATLGEPVSGELESFFSGEYSYADLHSILLNLEERLVVYRFREDGLFRIALNPRLEPVLAPIAAGRSVLFSPVPETEEPASSGGGEKSGPLDGRSLAALFSFFLSGKSRKKIFDECGKLFPDLDIDTIAGGLVSLGILEQDDDRYKVDGKRLSAFKDLSPLCRLEYLAAGAALYLQSLAPNPLPGYVHRSLLKNTVRLIHRLFTLIGTPSSPARLYRKPVLVKCSEVLRREEAGSWGLTGELPQTKVIIKALQAAGLVIPSGDYAAAVWPDGETPPPGTPAVSAGRVIAMDSPFSFVLYPGISFADALDLSLFCTIEETGTAIRFSISRASVVQGFNRGLGAGFLWALLEKCSGGRAGDALKWNLEDWEKRYREVALYRGVVLTLGGERMYLAENGPLAKNVRKVLAPGVFLLDVSSREEAAEVLRAAGVDILAEPAGEIHAAGGQDAVFPETQSEAGRQDASAGAPGSFFFSGKTESDGPGTAGAAAPYNGEKAERLKEKFRAYLESDGCRCSREERTELSARIERRLVVSESQLQDISIRYEKLEARSLDYAGKTAIAKQAIVQGSLLEVNWPSGGAGEKVLGTPETLEKKAGEMVLVLRPRDGRTENVRIPLGQISLLRRIKKSIFGE